MQVDLIKLVGESRQRKNQVQFLQQIRSQFTDLGRDGWWGSLNVMRTYNRVAVQMISWH